jgi:hypothetical protein
MPVASFKPVSSVDAAAADAVVYVAPRASWATDDFP